MSTYADIYCMDKDGTKARAAFGERLRALRISAGMSQEQLGEAAGLDRTYISSTERGRRNISLNAITKTAAALQKSPAIFFQPKDGAKR